MTRADLINQRANLVNNEDPIMEALTLDKFFKIKDLEVFFKFNEHLKDNITFENKIVSLINILLLHKNKHIS